MKTLLSALLLLICTTSYSQQTGIDTATVKSYSGLPVFFHCKPLHKYQVMGTISRVAMINHLSEAFVQYAQMAKKKMPECEAIVIREINLGDDQIEMIKFGDPNIKNDTATFLTPVFLAAEPSYQYEVIGKIKGKADWGPLTKNLERFIDKARHQYNDMDGIILQDVNYAFGRDEIMVIRKRKQ